MNHKSIQILRTSLNNTDTKIANEVLLDGQPLYNKTSNKLYVGDGTKKISELKYIGQEAWEDLNLENGTGTGSLVQKRLKSDGVTWTTAKAYQGASTALGGGTQAGRTEEEFNAYFWDSVHNVPLHDGQGKNSSGEILDKNGLTYSKSYSYAVAEGDSTKALSRCSHSEGGATKAVGYCAHAEGGHTTAEGENSHAEGGNTKAVYANSHAEGFYTITSKNDQHVCGRYNKEDTEAMMIVGNGTSDTDRKNAFEVLFDGRAKVQSAPIESNDVVRKLELDKKLDKTVVVQTTGNSTTDVMSQKAVTENFVNTHSEVEVGNSANITNKDGILQLSTDGFNGKSYLMSDENGYLKFLHTDLQGNTRNLITTDDYYLHFAKGSFDFDQGTQTILEGDVVFSNTIPLFNNGLQIQIGEAITYGTSDGGNKDVYAPSESGRTAIEPNSNPTETSLVTVSSTGTHAYKKVSEVVDTKSEQTLTGTKTWKVNEPGITKTLAVSASSVYSKTDYSDGTRQSATFFSGGINLNKSTESNPIGDYTSIGFPYLVNHTDDVYKLALAPDVVPTEPSIIVNATDRHVTWKPLSELEVSVPTRSQVDLLF